MLILTQSDRYVLQHMNVFTRSDLHKYGLGLACLCEKLECIARLVECGQNNGVRIA